MNKTAESVWSNCLSFIKDNISESSYETWFKPIKPVRLEQNTLCVEVPTKYFCEWIEENYLPLIRSAFNRELGPGAKLMYVVKMGKKDKNTSPLEEQLPSTSRGPIPQQSLGIPSVKKSEIKNPFVLPGIQELTIDAQLNPNQNFDTFIEGKSNRMARSAAMAVANKPGGTSFNPLFIYGGVGLGKTHLGHAIGVEIKEKYPQKKVLYVSTEKFVQQYTTAIREKERNEFIHFYQLIDVLILDDIQFLSGKPGTQEVFFHIFNHMQQNQKQVILTSDRAPIDLQDIENRLLSRFKWGLQTEILSPDFETRFAILKNKFLNDGATVDDQIIAYLAKHVTTNIRELEGVGNSLIAQAAFNQKDFSLDLARIVVEKSVRNIKKEITIDHIQKTIADYFQLTVEELHSKTRKRHIVQARQLVMFFAKKYTQVSLVNIGRQIGKRNHATVVHACKTVENLNQTDKTFQKYVSELSYKIKS